MPIYEYFCKDCNTKFELLKSLGNFEDSECCLHCGKPAKRILSTFASFSKNAEGMSTAVAGTAGGCNTCSATNCASC